MTCGVLVFVVFVSFLGYGQAVSSTENSERFIETLCVLFLSGVKIRDPGIAVEYRIYGHLSLDVAQDTPKQLFVRQGEVSVTLLLKFVSHKEDVTEAEVTLDPSGEWGLKIEVTYGDRYLCLNDLVSYDPSGRVRVEAGHTLLVKMNFKVPENYPHVCFPLGGVGITSNFAIIDNIYGVDCLT